MKLKPYSKYKESGVQWIGEIPQDWVVKRIKHICLKNADYGLNESSEDYADNGVRFLRITDIIADNELIEEGIYLPKKNIPKEYLLNEGDILIARSGSVGTSLYFNKKKYGECSFAGYLIRFVVNKLNNSKLLYYFTKSKSFDAQIDSYSIQTTIGNFNGQKYANMHLAIAPYSEQLGIINFLDKKTSEINHKINQINSLKNLFKEKRLALVGEVILNEKNPKIRLQHVAKNISRPIKKLGVDNYTPLGLYNWGRGIFHKSITEEEDLGDSKFFFVKEGDLILSGQFAWEGAVAIAGPKEDSCIVSHRFPIIEGIRDKVNNEYLWALFTSDLGHFLLNQSSVGSAGRNRPLNINLLMKEKIPVPTMAIQEKIKKIIQKEKELDILIGKLTLLLEEYKKSIIHHVVTGKVDVRKGVE
jgi:type I restriction enzyme S subunit